MEKKEITPEMLALQTGHYPTFSMALAMAMTRAVAWIFTDTGDVYSAVQLFSFAQKYDEKPRENGQSFFMVSAEGAIGISPGLEYLTKWIFVPAVGEKRDAALEQMRADIEKAQAEIEAEAKAATEKTEKQ